MNSMERVLTALSHKEPDHVPVYPILSGITRKLVNATYEQWSTDADVCAAALRKAAEQYAQDCIVTLVDLSLECDAWGQKLLFPPNDAAHPDYAAPAIPSIEAYASIRAVDYRTSKRMMFHIQVCKKLVRAVGDEKPVVAFVFGPLGVLSMLRGQQNLYMDLYDDPDAVKAAAREINETLKEYVNAIIDTGVTAVMFDTLFASGAIMSKTMWDETEGPLVQELAQVCHDRGVAVMIHNCGQRIYFDVQIKRMRPAAISFLYPPDDCADFAECKRKYGDTVTLIGCVPPPLAMTGTDEEWENACREQIDVMAGNGGFILATGCEYPANASFDRAKKMVEVAQTYGKYSEIAARAQKNETIYMATGFVLQAAKKQP